MKGVWIKYSQDELSFIESRKTLPRRELTELLNEQFSTTHTVDNIKSLCTRNKWNTGRTGCFEKGNIPAPNARPNGPNKTSFKKGHVPITTKTVGDERVNVEGYREIKISSSPHKWRLKQRLVYEQHHNVTLKDDDVIRFIDGNRMNCEPKNLELFNRSEHMLLNKMNINDFPHDIQPIAKNIVRVQAKAAQMEKRLCQ